MVSERATADLVGPVLRAGPPTDAVIAAIQRLNGEVQVIDRGAYLRVLVPQRCEVTRAAIEAALARPFRLPGDLEAVMVSFRGRLQMDETAAVWQVAAAGGVRS
jgi:hypothetical protein